MKSARLFIITLLGIAPLGLMPAMALAHGANGNAADPVLHVDPTLKDCSVHFAPELTQADFGRFVREFGSVSAFKTMSPPATLGRGRVALAVEQFAFTVDDKADAWNDTFAHPEADHWLGSNQSFPQLRLRAGVTDRLDVGAFYTRNPNANYGWLGFEAKYGLLRQSETMPITLAIRGAYTKTLYVDDMDMHAASADLEAGRTYRNMFTPYVGVGQDAVLANETSDVVNLEREIQIVQHAFAGLEVRYGHVALGAEVRRGALTSSQFQVTALF